MAYPIPRHPGPHGRPDALTCCTSAEDVHFFESTTLERLQTPCQRLRELLLNLVENTMKYSHPAGKVEIALFREKQDARLSITDHGIGIAPSDHAKIFQRFFRSDAARAHTKKGTGLGLAICAWIADLHKGRIEVQSELGQGSTFTVVLPLAPPT